MAEKTIETESSLKALENLKPFFDARETQKTFPFESPYLTFLEPLWGAIPQQVYARNGEFVVGNAIPKEAPENIHKHKLDNDRTGIWNAATGDLVFKREGAVSVAWTPNFLQVGVWIEYYVPDTSLSEFFRGNTRSEWHWKFERWDWETKSLLSSCDVKIDGVLYPAHLEFPKKYKGNIAKMYCRHEDGGESIFILCDHENGDRELTSKEMAEIQKGKWKEVIASIISFNYLKK